MDGREQQIPPRPYLLYDVRSTSALTYGQLRVKTCMKQDPLSRSKLFDDINVPIFAPVLHIPITDHSVLQGKIKTYPRKRLAKESKLPLLVSPYSYTVLPSNHYTQIGLDTNLMYEEYERHYVSPNTLITPHPRNTMDAYIYSNLYSGIDVDNYSPSKDTLIPYKYTPYESPMTDYVTMPYVPEPVILNDKEKSVLTWCEKEMPVMKPLIASYRLTKTPQVWFEYLTQLWHIKSVSPATLREEYLVSLRTTLKLPASSTMKDIQQHIATLETRLTEEQKKAEMNHSVCYGLSIRKVYMSLEAFQQDVRNETTLYWDSDRDTLQSDITHIRQTQSEFSSLSEEDLVNILQESTPFLSTYEIKRRAHEIKLGNRRTQIRPGDLVMIRLPNATYIYQSTSDGWVSRT